MPKVRSRHGFSISSLDTIPEEVDGEEDSAQDLQSSTKPDLRGINVSVNVHGITAHFYLNQPVQDLIPIDYLEMASTCSE